jgi:hypothetical protein
VRFCDALDNVGHSFNLKIVKGFEISLLPPGWQQQLLGTQWLAMFLDQKPSVTLKFSQCVDRQRANANNPTILKIFYCNV